MWHCTIHPPGIPGPQENLRGSGENNLDILSIKNNCEDSNNVILTSSVFPRNWQYMGQAKLQRHLSEFFISITTVTTCHSDRMTWPWISTRLGRALGGDGVPISLFKPLVQCTCSFTCVCPRDVRHPFSLALFMYVAYYQNSGNTAIGLHQNNNTVWLDRCFEIVFDILQASLYNNITKIYSSFN